MKSGREVVVWLILCLVVGCDARSLGRDSSQASAQQPISPPLDGESSKKFFKKDYPNDHRPGVDVLHFKHPYPVVQDSGDFDSDYVKDENSDNGNWKAQQEYDRLRHKLQREKAEAAKALEKKQQEEQELKRAMEKYQKEQQSNKDKREADATLAKATEKIREEAAKKIDNSAPAQSWSWSWPSWSWPTWTWPAAVKSNDDEGTGIRSATRDTEKAMDNLKDCEDELTKAKKQMEELEDSLAKAKAAHAAADAASGQATKKHLEAQKIAEGEHDKMSKEKAEYEEARAAYLEQEAVVAKLKADLDAAAAKVKAQRDAEDKSGGVYNSPDTQPKSSSIALSLPRALVIMLAATSSWHIM